mgnify:FL=1
MTKNPFVPLLRTRSISFAVSRSWRTRGGCATCVFSSHRHGARVCMSAPALEWDSSCMHVCSPACRTMEFLECGHATNDKREYCEVCRQRFNELEYGAPKYKDMGPYGYGCMGRHIWVHIWHGPSYGCGRTGPHMDMGAREPYGYGCMGPHMDMGAWVLIYGCISHAEDKPFSHADGHVEVDSDSVAHSVPRISRHMHNGPEQHK